MYNLRCEFRQRAFKKEHWDLGHEFKIKLILTKLIEYENHLAVIFHNNIVSSSVEIDDSDIDDRSEVDDSDIEVELIDNLTKIHQQNQSIIAEERCWAEEIPLMIKETEQIMKQKLLLVDLIKSALGQILGQLNIDYLFKLTNSDQMIHNYILLLDSLYIIDSRYFVASDKTKRKYKPQLLLVKGTSMTFDNYVVTIKIDHLKEYYRRILERPLLIYISWNAALSRPKWDFRKVKVISYIFPMKYIIIPLPDKPEGKEINALYFELSSDGYCRERLEKVKVSLDLIITGLPEIGSYQIDRRRQVK